MNSNDQKTTDLVLTLTPHIIRIPDVTEEDVTPYFVGTDENISYQGGPRVENPTRDPGPFDPATGGGKAPAGQPPPPRTPAAPVPNPGINLAPGGGPTDIFRPQPAPPPTSPQQQVPPQGASATQSSSTAVTKSEAADADVAAAFAGTTDVAAPVLFDFDPAYVPLSIGAQQTLLVRATAAGSLPGGTIAIRFDPAVVGAVFVRPILGSGSGVAEGRIENGKIVVEFPGTEELTGTRALAEITLVGVAPGRSTLNLEPAELAGVAVTSSQAVVDVK